MVCVKIIDHCCYVGNRKTPIFESIVSVGKSASLVYHCNGGPSGWDISDPTKTNDGFYLSYINHIYPWKRLIKTLRVLMRTFSFERRKSTH